MAADLELRLIHDGRQWIAGNDNLQAAGRTLAELDRDLKNTLLKSGNLLQGAKVTVLMKFDAETMPNYANVRQYRPEYFHRLVVIDL
ncbi:MAG: hypothetical protein PWP70_464 [Moorella sp. (in: firmicutes)]|nr:hypothetical protein [Moorella sp. (in: firmicutes)]